jgi:hypothetical protein
MRNHEKAFSEIKNYYNDINNSCNKYNIWSGHGVQ